MTRDHVVFGATLSPAGILHAGRDGIAHASSFEEVADLLMRVAKVTLIDGDIEESIARAADAGKLSDENCGEDGAVRRIVFEKDGRWAAVFHHRETGKATFQWNNERSSPSWPALGVALGRLGFRPWAAE